MHLLHDLHGHSWEIHFLLFSLKIVSGSKYFLSFGTGSQTFGARFDKVLVSLNTEYTRRFLKQL